MTAVVAVYPDVSARLEEAEGCAKLKVAEPAVVAARAKLAAWRAPERTRAA